MTPALRAIFATAFLAATAPAAQSGSPRIEQGDVLGRGHVAVLSLPTTTSLLARVTAHGTTKLPGHALDGRLGSSPALDHASHRLDGLVRMAICKGC